MKKTFQAFSSNPLDYPASMSGYERDSLVAEAILAAEKKKEKRPKTAKTRGGHAKSIGKTR